MKKLSVILSILFFCVSACFADDVQPEQNKQLVEVENAEGGNGNVEFSLSPFNASNQE